MFHPAGTLGTDTDDPPDPPDPPQDDGAPPSTPEPFELRAYLAENLEYDGNSAFQGASYAVPDNCVSTDIPPDINILNATMNLVDWETQRTRDFYRAAEETNTLLFENSHLLEEHDGLDFFGSDRHDAGFSDARDLFVYSGHGTRGGFGTNQLAEGTAHCDIDLEDSVRAGAHCGAVAKVGAWASSCTGSFNDSLCPLAYTPEGQQWGPWPAECWAELDCTAFRSRLNHALMFVDSPTLNELKLATWFEKSHLMTLSQAWISEMMFDDLFGVPNQPMSLLLANSQLGLNWSFNQGSFEDGGKYLQQVGPVLDEDWAKGLVYVQQNGQSGVLDAEGNPIVGVLQQASTCASIPYCEQGPGFDLPSECNSVNLDGGEE